MMLPVFSVLPAGLLRRAASLYGRPAGMNRQAGRLQNANLVCGIKNGCFLQTAIININTFAI